jgi:hypothetical protein
VLGAPPLRGPAAGLPRHLAVVTELHTRLVFRPPELHPVQLGNN